MRTSRLLSVLGCTLLLSLGCSESVTLDDGGVPDDTGVIVEMDSDTPPPPDSGPVDPDSGVDEDGGVIEVDAGPPCGMVGQDCCADEECDEGFCDSTTNQ